MKDNAAKRQYNNITVKYTKNMDTRQKLNEFGDKWQHYNGNEIQNDYKYWINLMQALSIPTDDIQTQQNEANNKRSDVSINADNISVIIEQKAPVVNLDKLERRNNTLITPLQQVLYYANARPVKPDKIITCNYRTIRIYDTSNVNIYYDQPMIQKTARIIDYINKINTRIKNNETTDAHMDKKTMTINDVPDDLINYVKNRTIPQPEAMIEIHVDSKMGDNYADKMKEIFTNANITSSQITDVNIETNREAAKHFNKLKDLIMSVYANDELCSQVDYHNDAAKLLTLLVFMMFLNKSELLPTPNYLVDYFTGLRDNDNVTNGLYDMMKAISLTNDDIRNRQKLIPDARRFSYISDIFKEYDDIMIPDISSNSEIITRLLQTMNSFDWSRIDAVIFGSMMEDLLNADDRRQNGIHWTPAKYIHRIIDPLCIDALTTELQDIINNMPLKPYAYNANKLIGFIDKLAKYRFIDPACGSANFLAETYLTMRHLENQALKALHEIKYVDKNTGELPKQRVSLSSFAGIEYNEYAYLVARITMLIAYLKASNELNRTILDYPYAQLPITDDINIIHADALAYDWNNLFNANANNEDSHKNTDENNKSCSHDDYIIHIIGNPPFVGQGRKTAAQNESLNGIMTDYVSRSGYYANDLKINKDIVRNTGYADYCYGWFYKAADYLRNYPADKCGFSFISTANINKGVQVKYMKPITDNNWGLKFAYEPFKWANESKDANVTVMITSFSKSNANHDGKHLLFTENVINTHDKFTIIDMKNTKNNVRYLLHRKDDDLVFICYDRLSFTNFDDNDNIYVIERKTPISEQLVNVKANRGLQATDGNYLIIDNDVFNGLSNDDKKYIRKYITGASLMESKLQWCIWLPYDYMSTDATDFIKNRVKACQEWRSSQSKTGDAYKIKDTPWKFRQGKVDFNKKYIAISQTQQMKDYIISIIIDNAIANNSVVLLDDSFSYSILNKHMALWCKKFSNKIGTGQRITINSIYNTFPMPCVDESIMKTLHKQSEAILSIQKKYLNASNVNIRRTPAELYRSKPMPADLLNAHQALDRMFDALFTLFADNIKTGSDNPFIPVNGAIMNTRIDYNDYVNKLNELNNSKTIISDYDRIRMMITCYNYLIKNEK